jgi:plasmid stabilization system protein ParE
MVRYKIEWSLEAREDLIDILDFYNKRNDSSAYSRKLYIYFQKRIKLLS